MKNVTIEIIKSWYLSFKEINFLLKKTNFGVLSKSDIVYRKIWYEKDTVFTKIGPL